MSIKALSVVFLAGIIAWSVEASAAPNQKQWDVCVNGIQVWHKGLTKDFNISFVNDFAGDKGQLVVNVFYDFIGLTMRRINGQGACHFPKIESTFSSEASYVFLSSNDVFQKVSD